jgi:methionyl-tRNA synthetase
MYFLHSFLLEPVNSDYREERAVTCLNAELCNNVGNLLQRCTGKSINSGQMFPTFDESVFKALAGPEDDAMWKQLRLLPGEYMS